LTPGPAVTSRTSMPATGPGLKVDPRLVGLIIHIDPKGLQKLRRDRSSSDYLFRGWSIP